MSVISFSGLASGLDTSSWVSALTALKNAKIETLQEERSAAISLKDAVAGIKSYFTSFRNSLERLTDAKYGSDAMDLFVQNLANSSDPSKITASATSSAARDTYEIDVKQVASNTKVNTAIRRTVTVTNTAAETTKLSLLGVKEGYVSLNDKEFQVTSADTIKSVVDKMNDIGINAYYEEDKGRFTIASDIFESDDGLTDLFDCLGLEFKAVSGEETKQLMTEGLVALKPTTMLSEINANQGQLMINQNLVDVNLGANATVQDFLDYINTNYAATGANASIDADGYISISGIDIQEVAGGSNLISALGLVEKIDSVTSMTDGLTYTRTESITLDTKLGDINTTFANYNLVLGTTPTGGSTTALNANSTVGDLKNAIENFANANGMDVNFNIDEDGMITIDGDIDKLYISGGVAEGLGFDIEKVNGTSLTSSLLEYTHTLTANTSTTWAELGITGTNLNYSVMDERGNAIAANQSVGANTTIEAWFNSLKQYGIEGSITEGGVISIDGDGFISGNLATALGMGTVKSGEVVSGTSATSNALAGVVTTTATLSTTLAELGINSNQTLNIQNGAYSANLTFTSASKISDIANAIEAAGGSFEILDDGSITIKDIDSLTGSLVATFNLNASATNGTSIYAANVSYNTGSIVTEASKFSEYGISVAGKAFDIYSPTGDKIASNVTLASDATVSDLFAILNSYGLDTDITSNGELVISDGYISGALANALGITNSAYNTVVAEKTLVSKGLSITVSTTATMDTTLAELGLNGSYDLSVNYNGTTSGFNFGSSNTLADIRDKIVSTGASFDLTDGFVSISNADISGGLVSSLGIAKKAGAVQTKTTEEVEMTLKTRTITTTATATAVTTATAIVTVTASATTTAITTQTVTAAVTTTAIATQTVTALATTTAIATITLVAEATATVTWTTYGTTTEITGYTTSVETQTTGGTEYITYFVDTTVTYTGLSPWYIDEDDYSSGTAADIGISSGYYCDSFGNAVYISSSASALSAIADLGLEFVAQTYSGTLNATGSYSILSESGSGAAKYTKEVDTTETSYVTHTIGTTYTTRTISTSTHTATAATTVTTISTVTEVSVSTEIIEKTTAVTMTNCGTNIMEVTLGVTYTTVTSYQTETGETPDPVTTYETTTEPVYTTSVIAATPDVTTYGTTTIVSYTTSVIAATSGSTTYTTTTIVSYTTSVVAGSTGSTTYTTTTIVSYTTSVVAGSTGSTTYGTTTIVSYTTSVVAGSTGSTTYGTTTITTYTTTVVAAGGGYRTDTLYGTTTITNYGTTVNTSYGTTTITNYGTTTITNYGTQTQTTYGTTTITNYGTTTITNYGTSVKTTYTTTTITNYGTTTITNYQTSVKTTYTTTTIINYGTTTITNYQTSVKTTYTTTTIINYGTTVITNYQTSVKTTYTTSTQTIGYEFTTVTTYTTYKISSTYNYNNMNPWVISEATLTGGTAADLGLVGDYCDVFGNYVHFSGTESANFALTQALGLEWTTQTQPGYLRAVGTFYSLSPSGSGAAKYTKKSSTTKITKTVTREVTTGTSTTTTTISTTKTTKTISTTKTTKTISTTKTTTTVSTTKTTKTISTTKTTKTISTTKTTTTVSTTKTTKTVSTTKTTKTVSTTTTTKTVSTTKTTKTISTTKTTKTISTTTTTVTLPTTGFITNTIGTTTTTKTISTTTTAGTASQTITTGTTRTTKTISTTTTAGTASQTITTGTTTTVKTIGTNTTAGTAAQTITTGTTTTVKTIGTNATAGTAAQTITTGTTTTVKTISTNVTAGTAAQTITTGTTQTVKTIATNVTQGTAPTITVGTTYTTFTEYQTSTETVIMGGAVIEKTVVVSATATVVKTDTVVTSDVQIRTVTHLHTSTYIEYVTKTRTFTDTSSLVYRSDQKTHGVVSTTFDASNTLLNKLGVSNGVVSLTDDDTGSSKNIFTVNSNSTLADLVAALNLNGYDAKYEDGRVYLNTDNNYTLGGAISGLSFAVSTSSVTYFSNSTSNILDNRATSNLTGTTTLGTFAKDGADRVLELTIDGDVYRQTFLASSTVNDVVDWLKAQGLTASINNGVFQVSSPYHEIQIGGSLGEVLLGDNPTVTQSSGTGGYWTGYIAENSQNVAINLNTKISDLGISTGGLKIYDNGSWINTAVYINEDTTIADLRDMLAAYDINLALGADNKITLSSDSDKYLSDESSNFVSKLGLTNRTQNKVDIFDQTNSKSLTVVTTTTLSASTTLKDLGFASRTSMRIEVNGAMQTMGFTSDETIQDIIDALSAYGIDASINNGIFTAFSEANSFEMTGSLADKLNGNAPTYLATEKVISYNTGDLKTDVDYTAENTTKLTELGVKTGYINVERNGEIIGTMGIDENTTIQQLINGLSPYNIACELDNTGVLTIKSIGDVVISDGTSNLVTKLGLDDHIKHCTYDGTTLVLEDEVDNVTEDTLLSYFDTVDKKAAGSLHFEVVSQDGKTLATAVNIDENETFGSLMKKLERLGLDVTLENGVLSYHNGLGSVNIVGGSSALVDTLQIVDADLETWMQNTNKIEIEQEEIRYDSIVNFANNNTKLSTLGVITGEFSIGINGQMVSITVDENDTIGALASRISAQTGNRVTASLTDNGNFKLEAADGIELVLGLSIDSTNLVTVFDLDDNGSNVITGNTSLYRASDQSKITDAGLFRLGNVTAGTFKIGNATFTITSDTTISSLVADINRNEEANATAYWDNINGRLQLTSKALGAAYVDVSSGTSNFTEIFGLTVEESGAEKLATYNQKLGNNAILTINGTRIVATSNTITSDISRIEGLTVNVKDITAGESVTVKVERNTQVLVDAVKETLEQYNALIAELTNSVGMSGSLHGDVALNAIKNEMASILTASATNGASMFRNLAAVGISTEAANSVLTSDIYSLHLDEERFRKALDESETEVKLLLVGTVDAPGILTRVGNILDSALSASGYFATKTSAINRDIANFDKKINKITQQTEAYKSLLERKFNNMENLYSTMQAAYSNLSMAQF